MIFCHLRRQMLDHDLEEAEEQYQQAVRAHLVTMDQVRSRCLCGYQ